MSELKRSYVRVGLALLLAPVALVVACYARSELWWSGAERTVADAIRATAAGDSARNIDIDVQLGTGKTANWNPVADFQRPYVTKGADSYLLGITPRALLDPAAGAYVAHLVFDGGHAYHVEATRRRGGRWIVQLQPAENQ